MFFTKTDTGRKLYKDHLSKLPIIELGGGFNPADLAQDNIYPDPAAVLLNDPQKWRYMRSAGIDEQFITGTAPPREKFQKYCEAVQRGCGSPVYTAAYVELESIFPGTVTHIGEINGDNAPRIWEKTSEAIKREELSPRKITALYNAEYIHCNVCPCETAFADFDLLDKFAQPTHYLPVYNATRLLKVCGKREYLGKLSAAEKTEVKDFPSLKDVINAGVNRFAKRGARIITARLDCTEFDADALQPDMAELLTPLLDKDVMSCKEEAVYRTAVLRALAEAAYAECMILRLVTGQRRDGNRTLHETAGQHSGCGYIESVTPCGIAGFLNSLAKGSVTPKIIIENADTAADTAIASVCAAFQTAQSKLPSIQQSADGLCGATYNRAATHARLTTLAGSGYLAGSIGITAETAGIPSLARHICFRSAVADFLGCAAERGDFTSDVKILGSIAEDIAYYNAKLYVHK